MSEHIDVEKLRVMAVGVLENIDHLVAEGLPPPVRPSVVGHAKVLAAGDGAAGDLGSLSSAFALWEALRVLGGPTSTTLVTWLDDAIGALPAPVGSGTPVRSDLGADGDPRDGRPRPPRNAG